MNDVANLAKKLAEAKIDFELRELTINMKPVEIKNDKPPQLDLQHIPAEEQEKLQCVDPRQPILTEDVLQRKQQEPATMASRRQKKKAPPQQSRRNKNQKCGFKRKTDDAGASNKRSKQNGQGKPKVAKRTAETSKRCLRSKQLRLQAEDQRPECSRNQERRAQSSKQPADHLPPQRKYPRMERQNYKRKRDEQQAGNHRHPKARKLAQTSTYPTFKDWAKKRMADHNMISSISYSNV
ncbi:hypothetical protein X975_04082, partial [Stegodyphus mimosarum]